jgi:flagellar biogenesis protein FliO
MKGLLRGLLMAMLLAAPLCAQTAFIQSQPVETTVDNKLPPAASHAKPTAADKPILPDLRFPWMRTMGGMGLVICLMIGTYFAAKKFAPRYFAKGSTDRNLKVIETLSMGDKRSISMIEVAGSRFLVGNTPNQISLLAALPEQISLMSEPETPPSEPRIAREKELKTPFRNLFEVEKRRPMQYAENPLPEDIRSKMRQLREALER